MGESYNGLTEKEFVDVLVDKTGMEKRDVNKVLRAQADLMVSQLAKRGCREAMIPYLGYKLRMTITKATKARSGRNPATGDSITIAAQPPKWKVKGKPLAKITKALEPLLPKANPKNW